MTEVINEDDLEISVTGAVKVSKFDDPSTHAVGFMKAVDFVIEFPDRYVFVEFKDPQAPSSRQLNLQQYVENFQKERLDSELIYKCRDSFLYEWASGRAEKDIYYFVLIAIDSLTTAELGGVVKRVWSRSWLPVVGRRPGMTPPSWHSGSLFRATA